MIYLISLALYFIEYEYCNTHLPPAYTVDKLEAWHVLLLPVFIFLFMVGSIVLTVTGEET